MVEATARPATGSAAAAYRLDEQVGFILRKASQRHLAIFAELIPELTPMQFAALAKAFALGPVSQNELGRETAMDGATIKGVVQRLAQRGLVGTQPSRTDRRRMLVSVTPAGAALFATLAEAAQRATERTLAPLAPADRKTLLRLLAKLT